MTTGQFLIERPCPIEGYDDEDPNLSRLPFPIWVHLPALNPTSYSHAKCDGLHYRVTRECAVAELGAECSTPYVCEHMGKLIE